MILCDNGLVKFKAPSNEISEMTNELNISDDDAAMIICSCDIAAIFAALVDRYNIDIATKIWTGSVEAYRDIVMKGEN